MAKSKDEDKTKAKKATKKAAAAPAKKPAQKAAKKAASDSSEKGTEAVKQAQGAKAEVAKPQTGVAPKQGVSASDYAILVRPILTEKTAAAGEGLPRVAFFVPVQADKLSIRAAIERAFNVEVQSVRTVNMLGKVKRTRRSEGRQQNYKKAYVTLKQGYSINLIEGL